MSDTQTAGATQLFIQRTFNAPRERVFAAMTSADLVGQWFGPPGTKTGAVTFDAREGGLFRIEMKNSDGEDFNAKGVVTEVRAPERIAYTFRWEEDEPNDEFDTFITIDFIERGQQTEMIFTHDGLRSELSRDNHAEGWNGSFGKLEALLG
jgi:uncharacterized protein YndB with AHSA1/START domain